MPNRIGGSFGTSRDDVRSALALRKANGEGSLGKSAEFRYMLTCLPPGESTRAFGYLSDPFIRRLVGPRTKIGQLRRLQVRRDLEMVSAAALLYCLAGHREAPTVPQLVASKYLPASFADAGIRLNPDRVAVSATYGSVQDLKPLKEALSSGPKPRPLVVPEIAPAPVAMLSVNLSENVWGEAREALGELGQRRGLGLARVADQIGPAGHLAGLFTTAQERGREMAMRGATHLLPFLLSGAPDVSAAQAECQRLFGYMPQHPAGGEWRWDGTWIRSSVYGDFGDPVQPAFDPKAPADFGLLGGLRDLSLDIQFEDGGLRVIARWQLTATD